MYPKQLFAHDPANGVFGDCHRTCIAGILGLDPEQVPHPYTGDGVTGPEAWAVFDAWLQEHFSLRQVSMLYPGATPLKDVLDTVEAVNPGLLFMLGGRSRTGVDHTVIAGKGQIIHDPSKSNSGIAGPCADGYWWVTFLGVNARDWRDLPADFADRETGHG